MAHEVQKDILVGNTGSSRLDIQAILENIVSPITAIKIVRSCSLEDEYSLDQADKFFNSPDWKIAYVFAIKAVKIIKALPYYDEMEDFTLAEIQKRIEKE
jgi:hypothetical protein